MSGYIGTKSVTLSTTTANVGGDSTVGGDLTVDTNTLYVDSTNNRVGVGTVSPSYLFHASGSGDAVAAVTAGATSIAALNLGNSTNLADGGIRYDNSADALIFRSANAERLRILSSGGITFNGDTAAANALDDYEEGTWTPSFLAGFSTVTYGVQSGLYVKIGCLVYCDFYIYFSGTGNSAQIQVQGLPFNSTSGHSGYARGGGTSSYQSINNSTAQFYGTNNSSIFSLYENGNAGLSSSVSLSNKYLIGTYVYKTDA